MKWLCEAPAKHCGIENLKGKIQEGLDADLCVWDPTADAEISKASLKFKNKLSPYTSKIGKGAVVATILHGDIIYSTDSYYKSKNHAGKLL